jgi:hypothetical protein
MSAVLHPEGLPQLKIRPGHLALAAIVYVRQSTRGVSAAQNPIGRCRTRLTNSLRTCRNAVSRSTRCSYRARSADTEGAGRRTAHVPSLALSLTACHESALPVD